IMQYGAPVRVYLDYSSGLPTMVIIYPQMRVRFDIQRKNSTAGTEIQLNSQVLEFTIVTAEVTKGYVASTCCDQTWIDTGPWHGFISTEAYRQHNFRDLGIAQSVSTGP